MSAYEIDLKRDLSQKSYRGEADTYEVIAEIKLYNTKFRTVTDCLIYKSPGDTPGVLKLVPLKNKKECRQVLLDDTKISLDNIFNLGLKLDRQKSRIHFYIDEEKFKVILPNLKQSKVFKLSDSSTAKTNFPGVQISLISEQSYQKEHKLGEICFDVDNQCNTILDQNCDLCPGRTYEVIASNCSTKLRKYCGNIRCGERGTPACIRGWKATKYNLDYCLPGSPLGFCKGKLRVFCENGELICN